MNLVKFIEFLRNRLKTVVRVCFVVLAVVVLLDAIPAIVDKGHAHTAAEHSPGFWAALHTAAEHWPGFWAAFGFIGCVLIIIFSKWFGHAGIMNREDYYDE